MIPCDASRHDLTSFVFEDLSPRRMGELGLHIGGCPACGEELKEIREVLALADRWEVPASTRRDLVLPSRPPRRPAHSVLSPWRAAAAALLLTAFGAWKLLPRQDPVPPEAVAPKPDPEALALLQEADRPDLADMLLASCEASAEETEDPVKVRNEESLALLRLRTLVRDPEEYLVRRARSGPCPHTAFSLLARRAPGRALAEASGLPLTEALSALRKAGVDPAPLAPQLLKASRIKGHEDLRTEALALLSDPASSLPLQDALDTWEEDGGQDLLKALAPRLEASPNEALLVLTRRSGHDRTWALAAGILARRQQGRIPRLLAEEGWALAARRDSSLGALDAMPKGRCRQEACLRISRLWLAGKDKEPFPATDGMSEALGQLLADLPGREAGRILERLKGVEALRDAVLLTALKEAQDPIPLIRLCSGIESPSLTGALEARAYAEPRLRGVIAAALLKPSDPDGSMVHIYTQEFIRPEISPLQKGAPS